MPRPVVALPCGSRSARRVGRPARASPAARLTAVVVLPTPPFWLTTASVLRRSFSAVSRQTDSDRSARAGGNVRQTLCGRRLFSQGCLAAPRVGTKLARMFHVKHRGDDGPPPGGTLCCQLRD